MQPNQQQQSQQTASQLPPSVSNPQQQQLPMASQVQIRQSLALKQIDQSSTQQLTQNQPLSPTNSAISAVNKQQQSEQRSLNNDGKGGRQTELKGVPQQLVGLTSVEFQIDDNSIVSLQDFPPQQQYEHNHFYLSQIYDEKSADFPFRMLSDVQNPNENYQILKLRINLPVQMTLEHIEFQLNQSNFEIFNKYLKFLRVEIVNTHQEREYAENQLENQGHQNMKNQNNKNNRGFIDKSLQKALSLDKNSSLATNQNILSSFNSTIGFSEQEQGLQKLHLKSGFLDSNKKVLELHTCGVSQVVNLVFLYYKKNRPNPQTVMELTEKKKEKMFSKTINVSDKIKNEILPLLNGIDGVIGSGDEDIDELDDEVAMISNKQQLKKGNKYKQQRPNDDSNENQIAISHEEIKIEMVNNKNPLQKLQQKQLNQTAQPKKIGKLMEININSDNGSSNVSSGAADENEETRNFNTLPRNYSDPTNKQEKQGQGQIINGINQLQNGNNNFLQNTGSYNDMEFNSNMIANDIAHLQESSQMQLVSQSEIFNFAEQEIFQTQTQDDKVQALLEMQKLLQKTINGIKITGFNTNSIPAVTNMAYFMNNSFLLRQKQLMEQALEYDYLSGVLMISFKKITQAAEVFRKIQTYYLIQIDQLQNKTLVIRQSQQLQNHSQLQIQKLHLKCAILELLTCESMCQPTQLNDKLQSIERMIALSQFKSVPKLTFLPVIISSDDPFSVMKRFLPQLLKFTVMCLTHKKEIVRMSGLKLLEFILETKGCSLDLAMVFILKALLKTYPNPQNQTYQGLHSMRADNKQETNLKSAIEGKINLQNKESLQQQDIDNSSQTLSLNNTPQQQQQQQQQQLMRRSESFSLNGFTQSVQEFFQYEDYRHLDEITQQQRDHHTNKPLNMAQLDDPTKFTSIKEPTSGFFSALKNAYNHTLETYISVLSSISSHILHQLFYEVIIPNILDKQNSPQLNSLPSTLQNDKQLASPVNPNNNNNNTQQLQQQHQQDMKLFSIKIAEKIITICQGDLFLSKIVLEFFINTVVQKPQTNQNSETVLTGVRNLWQSIRSKVFTNYSQKGLKVLIEWLVDKMSLIAQNAQSGQGQPLITESSHTNNPGAASQDISKLEITDEDTQQLLQLFDIVSMIAVARKNNEAEANSLIKIKQDFCLELYVLINPLMFWLDFSVEREERFTLFKSIYATIKDVIENLPPKRNDIDLLQIMEPILIRTKEFLKNNSPSLQMLKFLDIVLRDMKQLGYAQDNPEIQQFFLEMLDNFVVYIAYCLHEEVFSVFDKLFVLCSDVMSERVLTKCIGAMVDKYTLRNRGHKNSLSIFVKNLLEVNVRQHLRRNSEGVTHTLGDSEDDMDDQISIRSKNNYFEIVCDFCFFQNRDPFPLPANQPNPTYRDDFKSLQDLHDLYVDKLQFFIDILSQLTEMHVNLFAKFIQHPDFKSTLLGLLQKGEIQLRLKCHEILEIVCNYYIQHCPSKTVYRIQQNLDRQSQTQQLALTSQNNAQSEVMEVQYINHERLQLSQIVLECILRSLTEGEQDSYLQFNALILLDFLFQQMLPVPTYQNEMQKERINRGNSLNNNKKPKGSDNKIFDLANDEINDDTPEFEVTASGYTLMRLELIFKLWPHVQLALNSPWSNIRSICYGLICSMLKIDIPSLANETLLSNPQIGEEYVAKLKTVILPMLHSLLSSKESESKAGGLNILGSFCGLSYDFSKVKISKNMDFFKKNSPFISSKLWQLVFELQDDWDITIKEASVVLIQLCAPRNGVKYFDKIKKELSEKRFGQILQGYGLGLNNGEVSSRMSSARGLADHGVLTNNMIQASLNSNQQDTLVLSQQFNNQISNSNSIPFKNVTDKMSDLLALEQHLQNPSQNQMLSASNIFDRIGDTINSNIAGTAGIGLISPMALSDLNDEVQNATLDEEIKKFERLEQLQPSLPNSQTLNLNTLIQDDPFEFFVDKYLDDQIQEIISIFRNDFKPPKSLWIEKSQGSGPGGLSQPPDYYAEIYSQAIDQFNQQQAYLQQQQQQQQQNMVNNSPKNSNRNGGIMGGMSMVDALEDDLVKKFERERKEKERLKAIENKDSKTVGPVDNYKIFERHYEDGKDEQAFQQNDTLTHNPPQQLESLNIDTNIDAEPFQFLEDSPGKILPVNDSALLSNPLHSEHPEQIQSDLNSNSINEAVFQNHSQINPNSVNNNNISSNSNSSQQIQQQQQLQGQANSSNQNKPIKKSKKTKDEKKKTSGNNQLQILDTSDLKLYQGQNNLGPIYKHERTPIASSSQQHQIQLNSIFQNQPSSSYNPDQNNTTILRQGITNQNLTSNNGSGILTDKQQQQLMKLGDQRLNSQQQIADTQTNPSGVGGSLKVRKKSAGKDKKTTDELIEEYERKISKTKQKLEEEKRKTQKVSNVHSDNTLQDANDLQSVDQRMTQDVAAKSTPEFKQKGQTQKESNKGQGGVSNYILQDDPNSMMMMAAHPTSKSGEKKKNNTNNLNSSQPFNSGNLYNMNEIPKNYLSNLDNAKLMKQINNCFNDNSFNNINIGPVVMTTNIGSGGSTKHKQKLNKSFENILASNKYNLKHGDVQMKQAKQKNLSTSPRRGSSSGKKSGSLKNGINKKKYLDSSSNPTTSALNQLNSSKNQQKALQNMRDFNYFIKTIEKDQSDKYKLNLKDFNSMPTTPTSILKKVEDQMKALAQQNFGSNGGALSKIDIKAQMSNTCPNMAQVLSQLDTFGMPNHSQQLGSNPLQHHLTKSNNQVLQISNLKMNEGGLKIGGEGATSKTSEAFITSNHTPSNISQHLSNQQQQQNLGNLMLMAQSQNSLSGQSLGNHLDKFTFSKTQKIDIKEATKNLFSYQIPHREGQTARDHSNENKKFKSSVGTGGLSALLLDEASQIKAIKRGAHSKRSRGSQEKYLTQNHQANQGINHAISLINNNSQGSQSFTKLNKSLNNISQGHNGSQNTKKKDQLSKSMINNFIKAANISPKDKKMVSHLIKNQLISNPSQATTQLQQTPHTAITASNTQQQQQQHLNNQYSYSSNLLYDYIQTSEQSKRSVVSNNNSHNINNNSKTPVKNQPHSKKLGVTGKIGSHYSEVYQISPSSCEKEASNNHLRQQQQQYAKYIL